MRIAPFSLIAVIALVLVTPACELFGQVACEDDGDCPDSLPFCNSDVCAAEPDEDDDGRGIDGEGEGEEGEGEEGEGEGGGYSNDSDCSLGLCDIEGVFGVPGACLPPAGTQDCTSEGAAPGRAAAGPVIFALVATSIGDGCFADVSLSYFDREGDVSPTSPFLGVFVDGSPQTQTPQPSKDGKTLTIDTMCGASPESPSGLVLFDGPGNPSNTLCLFPPG